MHVHTPLADGSGKLTGVARFRQAQAGDRDSLNRVMVEHDGSKSPRSHLKILMEVLTKMSFCGTMLSVTGRVTGRVTETTRW